MLNQRIISLSKFLIFSLLVSLINTETPVYSIEDQVSADSNYLKAEFNIGVNESSYYFKYSASNIPSSLIGAFRFEIDEFSSSQIEILCKFFPEFTTDAQLITELDSLDSFDTACIGDFNSNSGIYDGIIKYDTNNTKLAIIFKKKYVGTSAARVYIRTTENILKPEEQTVTVNSLYSLIPFTLIISDFRNYASKILFYSRSRELQMYYLPEDRSYPEKLFFGNIMSIYTNPNMVRQKYKNANTMVLLPRSFDQDEPIGEQFLFQIKFFASDFSLDYYMGINQSGREKNTPLVINMTQCEEPYYVILN